MDVGLEIFQAVHALGQAVVGGSAGQAGRDAWARIVAIVGKKQDASVSEIAQGAESIAKCSTDTLADLKEIIATIPESVWSRSSTTQIAKNITNVGQSGDIHMG